MGICTLEVKHASFHTGRMKANPCKCTSLFRPLAFTALCVTLLAGGCIPKPPAPSPVAPPPSVQRPAPTPSPMTSDWRDAPITPGDWRWSPATTGSTASFSGGQFVMRCDRARNAVVLFRSAPGTAASITVSITTTEGTRSLAANAVAGGLEIALPARDPLLDAIAFSRGRFAVQAAGTIPLYMPSWTEISRVVEDCR